MSTLLPPSGVRGLERFSTSKKNNYTKTGKQIQFGARRYQKYASHLFCRKFNFEQLLFKAFLMRCVFLAVLIPKMNLLSHFCTYNSIVTRNLHAERLEWESRFNLRLNAAKINDYNKKYFKEKLFRIQFPTKSSVDA